jgi:hypothetical protein
LNCQPVTKASPAAPFASSTSPEKVLSICGTLHLRRELRLRNQRKRTLATPPRTFALRCQRRRKSSCSRNFTRLGQLRAAGAARSTCSLPALGPVIAYLSKSACQSSTSNASTRRLPGSGGSCFYLRGPLALPRHPELLPPCVPSRSSTRRAASAKPRRR